MRIVLLFIFLCIINPLFAQDKKLDSLKAELRLHPQDDTVKAWLSFRVATGTFRYDVAKSESLFTDAFEMADRLGWKSGKVKPLVWRGWHYSHAARPGQAMDDFLAALKIADEVNDTTLMAFARKIVGDWHPDKGQARKYLLEAVHLASAIKDSAELLSAYMSLNYNYLQTENWNEFDKGIELTLILAKQINDEGVIVDINDLIASKLENTGHFRESLPYSIHKISSERKAVVEGFVGERGNLAHLCAHRSIVFARLNELDSALFWVQEAERSMEDSPMSRAPIYEAYFSYYKAYGDYENALKYRLLYDSAQQVFSEFVAGQKIQEAIVKNDLETKDKLAKVELEKQQSVRNYIFTGTFFLLAFGGYAFYNFRRKRNYEKQQALTSERMRISRELHEDIGSTLGNIAVYSDVARKRSAKDEVSQEALEKIVKASGEVLEKMGDIIWNLNPENENFEQLLERMQAFSSMILSPRDIQVHFDFDESLKELAISPDHRKNLFLIFKESIHNIVKHAEANNVSIALRKENDVLKIRIEDDGKGFEMKGVKSVQLNSMGGNGLKSMTERAKTMFADFRIESMVNEGTTVELSINI